MQVKTHVWAVLFAWVWACSSQNDEIGDTSGSLTTSSSSSAAGGTAASQATLGAGGSGGSSSGSAGSANAASMTSMTSSSATTSVGMGASGGPGGTTVTTGSGAGGSGGVEATTTATVGGETTGSTSSGGGGEGAIAWEGDALWTGVRYYSGATPSNRTSGPEQGPTHEFVLTNDTTAVAEIDVSISGADAEWFQITTPNDLPATVEPGGTLTVQLQLTTDDTKLPPAPARDAGATVMRAELAATWAGGMAVLDMYALVLTYVELEPTFGQLMDAFPYEVDLGDALENDANPDPPTLPGVESGTDEVAAPSFQKADPGRPVTMTPLARFSPAGQVPYGWYPPGSPTQSNQVAVLAEQSDPHTNNKSRMLEPPLAEGARQFDPGPSPFSIYMQPDGQATIYSEDAQNSDGQHRLKVFAVHDKSGTLLENTYLLGGEEASNGDYQDYVFLLGNVTLP